MTSRRYARLKELLLAVTELPEDKRGEFLDRACGADLDLRREIEAMLVHDKGPPQILQSGAILFREPVESSDTQFLIGRTFSHYKIVGLLGTGGMGDVYKAEDIPLRRSVALKFLRSDAIGHGDMKARFIREAQAAAALDHPNICTVHAIEEVEGRIFLTMACIEGQTLKERIAQGPIATDDALDIAIQAGAGLEAAHAKGIVHRDIKSSNIMLSQDGRALILDFGLARSTDLSEITKTGAVMGTVAYMSPEQARGEPVDDRSDIWSLGVVLYEMLSGALPFRRDHELSVIYAILNETPAPLSQARPDLPAGLVQVVEKAMANERTDRYQRVGDLIADLRLLKGGNQPLVAGTPAPRARAHLSPTSQRALRHNLPLQTTSFIGREQEIAEILATVPSTRLLTLTGVGGTGKTRLAIKIGTALLGHFPDGVWFVELAGLTDAGFVSRTVAAALGIREEYGRSLDETMVESLRSARLLVILDNCEHLVEACAALADRLLRACPALSLLATSREALDIQGERIYTVPPLALPSRHDEAGPNLGMVALARYDAISLFVERATAVRPAFAMTEGNASSIIRICRRLDGIPLAIELAAACVKVLSLEQLSARLDHSFSLLTNGGRTTVARHQTLRAAIEWSYDLLNNIERRLLTRLAVFGGGCTLEAIEAVWREEKTEDTTGIVDTPQDAAQGGEESELLSVLSSLVSKSLVILDDRTEPPRYRQLETIRQYAWERLGEIGEQERLRQAHLAYFLRLTEDMESRLSGADQLRGMNLIEDELDNVRSALEWSSKSSVPSGLRLAAALMEFWFNRDRSPEGSSHLLSLLSNPEAARQTLDRAKALNAAGSLLAWTLGDYEAANPLVDEALEIGRRLGDPLTTGRAKLVLGIIAIGRREFPAARDYLEDSLRIMHLLGREDYVGDIHHHLGNAALAERDYQRARSHFDQAQKHFVLAGHRNKVAGTLRHQGNVAIALGDIAFARERVIASLRMNRELRSDYGVLSCLVTIAAIRVAEGEYRVAARLLGALDALIQGMRLRLYMSDAIEYEAVKEDLRGRIDEGAFEGALAEGRLLSLNEAVSLGLGDVS